MACEAEVRISCMQKFAKEWKKKQQQKERGNRERGLDAGECEYRSPPNINLLSSVRCQLAPEPRVSTKRCKKCTPVRKMLSKTSMHFFPYSFRVFALPGSVSILVVVNNFQHCKFLSLACCAAKWRVRLLSCRADSTCISISIFVGCKIYFAILNFWQLSKV